MSEPSRKKYIKWGLIAIGLGLLTLVYMLFNPSENAFFPKCPFRWVTGLECPGCGSQRAIHHLLHLRVGAAMGENLLLVVSIPYLIAGFIFDLIKNPSPGIAIWHKRLFGINAIIIISVVIVLFWILRNIPPLSDVL